MQIKKSKTNRNHLDISVQLVDQELVACLCSFVCTYDMTFLRGCYHNLETFGLE